MGRRAELGQGGTSPNCLRKTSSDWVNDPMVLFIIGYNLIFHMVGLQSHRDIRNNIILGGLKELHPEL